MATLTTIATVFQEVVADFSEVQSFRYGSVWDIDGRQTRNYPLILLESQPDFETNGAQSLNGKQREKIYTFRVYIFDRNTIAERKAFTNSELKEGKELWVKQDALQDTFEKYLGEVARRLLEDHGMSNQYDPMSGFHGYNKQHNPELLEICQTMIIKSKVSCTPGTFS